MKRIPAVLVSAPNGTPMNLDQHNIAHERAAGRGTLYLTACGAQGQPVTLAQALTWSAGWCGRCFEQPRAHGGR